MFPKFTQCYHYIKGDKPYNIKDLASTVLGAGGPGLLVSLIAFIAGSYGIGAIFVTIGIVTAIVSCADLWLYHRLVCVSPEPLCAVGIVEDTPTDGGLGNFDNDQFFDLVLIPHRPEDLAQSVAPFDAATLADPIQGPAAAEFNKQLSFLNLHPKNFVLSDGFLGETLLKQNASITLDLPYDTSLHEAKYLHCEAEGDFWVKMKEWAWLIGTVTGVSVAAAVATAVTIGAAMCALGPILCAIGLLLALIAALIILAIGALINAGIANTLYEDGKGNVEDYHVGDTSLGPIKKGDKVAVVGEHVYDGFHEGWNEFHPMIAVMRINAEESSQYLQWNPEFNDGVDSLPADIDVWPSTIKNLTGDDMRSGLNSQKIRDRAIFLRQKWCMMIREAFDPGIKHTQNEDPNRWSIHPEIDSCAKEDEPPIIK